MSFCYIAIYWNNHHHLLHAVRHVTGRILWANVHLLFWQSLVPFTTAWMTQNLFAPAPVAVYGVSLLMPAIDYCLLSLTLLAAHGPDSTLARAPGRDLKGKISLFLYLIAVGMTVLDQRVSLAIYVLVALIWIVPDPRIEHAVARQRDDALDR